MQLEVFQTLLDGCLALSIRCLRLRNLPTIALELRGVQIEIEVAYALGIDSLGLVEIAVHV
jgi:hypothetical protein